jgi:hypothetical protein
MDMPREISELTLEMLKTFIKDIEQGKSVNDVGWIPLDEKNMRILRKVSFCEVDYENKRGRINPYAELPKDFLSRKEGLIFLEYNKSLSIIREIWRICRNDEEYYNTIKKGLRLMFQRARYTFWEEETRESIPDDIRSLILAPQWAKASGDLGDLLAKDLLKKIYGTNELTDTTRERYNNFHLSKIFYSSEVEGQWRKIAEYLSRHKEIVEFLGLIWFAADEADKSSIDYMGARLLILEETIKAVAVKRHIDEKSLRDKLKNLGEELDKLTEGESWGVDWSNVFIIPW